MFKNIFIFLTVLFYVKTSELFRRKSVKKNQKKAFYNGKCHANTNNNPVFAKICVYTVNKKLIG